MTQVIMSSHRMAFAGQADKNPEKMLHALPAGMADDNLLAGLKRLQRRVA